MCMFYPQFVPYYTKSLQPPSFSIIIFPPNIPPIVTHTHTFPAFINTYQIPHKTPANRRTLFDTPRDEKKSNMEEFVNGTGSSSATATMRPVTRDTSNNLISDITAQAQNTSVSDVQGSAQSDIIITIYNNGFIIGRDGPFRPLSDPANQQFLEIVKSGEVPAELEKLMQGTDASTSEKVAIKLDVKSEDYKAPSSFNFSSSRGLSMLDQPLQRDSALSQIEPCPYILDDKETKCVVQLVLLNRTRLRLTVNHSSTVAQLYQHINSLENRGGANPGQNYTLVGGFPVKEYNNGDITIGEAKLANSSLSQQIVQ